MNNDLFLNENFGSHLEKNYCDEDSSYHFHSVDSHENNSDEMKNYIYPLNKSKEDCMKLSNDNNQKKDMNEIELLKQTFITKKDEEERNNDIKVDSFFVTNNKPLDSSYSKINKKPKKQKNEILFLFTSDSVIRNNNNISKKKIDSQIIDDKNDDDATKFCSPAYDKKYESIDKGFLQEKIKTIETGEENNIKILGKKRTQNNKEEIKKTNLILPMKRPYNKRKLDYHTINFNDQCFPFKTGKGVINITTKFNNKQTEPLISDSKEKILQEPNEDENQINKVIEESSNLNLNLNDKNDNIPNSENDLYLMKFVTKKYYYNDDGKRKIMKVKRKYRTDIIRKKIKSRFHKSIKNIINENLKKAGSKMYFDCLPQCFIGNTAILLNAKYFYCTYRDILTTDFSSQLNNYRHTSMDTAKYQKNLKVLSYLESNPDISQKSGFDIIKNMKYIDLLNNYFMSEEFEESLNSLKDENESSEYMQSYIYAGKNYVNFFLRSSANKNNNNIEERQEEEDECEDEFNFDENELF